MQYISVLNTQYWAKAKTRSAALAAALELSGRRPTQYRWFELQGDGYIDQLGHLHGSVITSSEWLDLDPEVVKLHREFSGAMHEMFFGVDYPEEVE